MEDNYQTLPYLVPEKIIKQDSTIIPMLSKEEKDFLHLLAEIFVANIFKREGNEISGEF